MNLKELLEYYLVEEMYKGTSVGAKLNTTSWVINASGGKATPNDLYTYVSINNTTMSSNSALVEVGSTVTIGTISVSTTPTHTGTSSVGGTAAKVSNMFKYSTDGTTTSIVDSDSSTGTIPSVTFEYSTNFSTANASLSLKSNNGSIISNSSISGLMTSTISLNEASGTLSEGKLTVTLSYSNDASASRTINSSVTATTVSVYPVSNKNNVSTGTLTANGLTPTDSYTKATNNITKSETNINITAVYPIYTNCAFVTTSTATSAQPPQLKDTSTGWYNNGHGDSSTKLPLLNYIASDLNCVITIGETNPNEGANMAIAYMYMPKGRTFKVDSMATYNTDANKTFSGWVPETLGRKTWEKDSTTTIEVQGNQVEYDIYKNDATAGKCAFILTINKK